VDKQVFYSRIGYQFCQPICYYGGNLRLPDAFKNKMDKSEEVPKIKVTTSATVSTATTAPPPPPPPPPAPPGSSQKDEKDIKALCAKVLSSPTLEELQVKPLRGVLPIEPLEEPKDTPATSKESICRATLHKDFMKKVL